MKKFLVLYHAPVSASQQMSSVTPEQIKAGMDAWMTWANKAGNAIVDLGMPLGNGRRLTASSENDSTACGGRVAPRSATVSLRESQLIQRASRTKCGAPLGYPAILVLRHQTPHRATTEPDNSSCRSI